MRIIFFNIAWMKYYKGIKPGLDEPLFGGSWVNENHDAHEKFNFQKCQVEDGELCLGYFSTKSTNGIDDNQLHIEKIQGVTNKEDVVHDVCVVWCAKQADYDNRTVVVGWYKNASVFRSYQLATFDSDDDGVYEQWYNAVADAKDCVLLPVNERNRFTKWNVPRKRPKGAAYGFGSSNVWFANEPNAQEFVKKIMANINDYEGQNWVFEGE